MDNDLPGGQCSRYHDFTKGISSALLHRPDRISKGRGAHNNAMPFAVLSLYKGQSYNREYGNIKLKYR